MMLNYYFSISDNNNFIYSIDMIRINFELSDKIRNVIEVFLNLLEKYNIVNNFIVNKYISKSGLDYHYIYNVKIENDLNKCSFVIGTGLHCKLENEKKGFLEFNPNKCFQCNDFINFYNDFKNLCFSFVVKRYDLAIDIPINRDLIKMVASSKCNYQCFLSSIYEGSIINSSRTEYQGRRNSNKFCKLYDKKKESKLDYDLTRIEFTFDREEVNYKNLPKFTYISSKNLSKKNEIFLQLLLESNDLNFYLKKLDYRNRKLIKDSLQNYYLNLDLCKFKDIREKVLTFEF